MLHTIFRLMSIITLLALIASCGGDNRSSTPEDQGGEPPSSSRSFSGRAAKGLIANGIVEFYEYSQGVWLLLSTGTTDENGDFSVDLSGVSGAVKVVVTADASTKMVCDNPLACGDQFGELLSVSALEAMTGTPFSMMAIIPASRAGGTFAVTPVTHLAASLIDNLPDGTPISDGLIQLALSRAADIFGLAADFAWHLPIDITDSEQLGNTSSVMHALLSAAFLQASAELSLVLALDEYTRQFIDLAGQFMVVSGEDNPSLTSLVAIASSMAQELLDGDQLAAIVGALNNLIARWGESPLTAAMGSGNLDPERFADAVVLLDHLDQYLNLAGINADGTFFAEQVTQLNWLYSDEAARLDTQAMMLVFYEAAVNTVMASVSIAMSESGGCESFTGISLSEQPDGYMQLCRTESTLKLNAEEFAPYMGQLVAMEIELSPATGLLAGQTMRFALNGGVQNATATAELTGELLVTFGAEFAAVLQSMLMDGEEVPLEELLASIEVTVAVNGSGKLASTEDPDWFFEGMINLDGSVSFPRFSTGGNLLEARIHDGRFRSPHGDTIASIDSSASTFCGVFELLPTLAINAGDDASMAACFGFEAFGMPAMKLKLEGALTGLASFVSQFVTFIPTVFSGQEISLVEVVNQIDPSVLALLGNAVLEVDGFDATEGWVESRRYVFEANNNRIDVSHGPHQLSIYVTGLQGGYLFYGDTFVGTFTFDFNKTGLSIFLVDGTRRSYFLGPLSDAIEPELITLLLGFFEGIVSGGGNGGDSGGDPGDPGGPM
ncbi:MAG: hypothetical protein ACK4SX_06285 [Alcanivoracaceae bacterium]